MIPTHVYYCDESSVTTYEHSSTTRECYKSTTAAEEETDGWTDNLLYLHIAKKTPVAIST